MSEAATGHDWKRSLPDGLPSSRQVSRDPACGNFLQSLSHVQSLRWHGERCRHPKRSDESSTPVRLVFDAMIFIQIGAQSKMKRSKISEVLFRCPSMIAGWSMHQVCWTHDKSTINGDGHAIRYLTCCGCDGDCAFGDSARKCANFRNQSAVVQACRGWRTGMYLRFVCRLRKMASIFHWGVHSESPSSGAAAEPLIAAAFPDARVRRRRTRALVEHWSRQGRRCS